MFFSYKKGVAALFLFIILFLCLVMGKIFGMTPSEGFVPLESSIIKSEPESIADESKINANYILPKFSATEFSATEFSATKFSAPKFSSIQFPEDFWQARDKLIGSGGGIKETSPDVIEKFSCLTDF
jgi:hypothetical protein